MPVPRPGSEGGGRPALPLAPGCVFGAVLGLGPCVALRAALLRGPRVGLPRRCRRSECGISYGRGRSWFLEGRSSRPLKTCDSPLASRPRKRGQSSCPSDRAADAESGNGQSDGAADERTAVVVRFDARRRRRVEQRGERSARTADRASERQLPLRFSSAWHSLQDRPCARTRNSPQSV